MNLVERPRRLWSLEEYHRLVEVLLDKERVELIEGEVLELPAHNPPHSLAVMLLNSLFSETYGATHFVRVQLPLEVAPRSEPEPDFLLVAKGAAFDFRRHPTSGDLVMEVADTSLGYDREVKGKLYAQAQIPEYWILNLNERLLEVYREPQDGLYRVRLLVPEAEQVTSLISHRELTVQAMLPPAG